jgi:hypothetical protein
MLTVNCGTAPSQTLFLAIVNIFIMELVILKGANKNIILGDDCHFFSLFCGWGGGLRFKRVVVFMGSSYTRVLKFMIEGIGFSCNFKRFSSKNVFLIRTPVSYRVNDIAFL